MIKFTKLLKIGLPVATLTTAVIITATLLFSKREDNKDNDENKDKVLDDFEKPLELYQEEIINKPDNQDEDTKQEEKASDNKEELDENEQKAKSQIEEQLKKDPNKKKLIDDLLNNPKELAERLSLDDKLTEEQLKKIASKIQESENQNTKDQQGPDSIQEEEPRALEEQPQDVGASDPLIPNQETETNQLAGKEDEEVASKAPKMEKTQGLEEEPDLPSEPSSPNEKPIPEEKVGSPAPEEEQLVDGGEDREEEDVAAASGEPKGNDSDESIPPKTESADNVDSSSSDPAGPDKQEESEATGQPTRGQESDASDSSLGEPTGRADDESNEEEGSANSITEELLREMEEITGRAATAISYLQKLINKQ